ncbi:Lipoprotein-releasing system ATP-binding protein LolD [Rubripirellula lacrimiformis]|uniref:Lipoprotein-releasing system ATP-binding protein LolD n=1 Tax=Rubripirellula lacrimiformis TaxID=1930273 RepID=A0A517NKJ7_9BACT|nr:ABC transporter ATP-binding protein [Rubripirellula lacrimiformis]QDT07665.1 Lipoprotein-releasing system ATP-binding protein LolD [Rubripirellula lacrimiformis]
MTNLLEVNDVIKTFAQPGGGRLTVLDIPQFRIEEGEQVALVGTSGGGKTTLLHLIAGLLTPDSGSLTLDGTELTRLSEQGRDRFRASKIGYVFQTFNLLPAFSAIENVRLGMTFGSGRQDTERAKDLLGRVGLADRANYRPSQLSVGQQQRVAIARALAGKPRLLLADEPTANVDPVSAESVLELIRSSCRDEDIAMLIVTHDMDIAAKFDRIERLEDINRALAPTA